MNLFVVPVLVALLAQFGSLPLLAGRGSSAGELIVWPMIMAIFFGVPSLVVYSAIFGGFRIMSPPTIICLLLGIGIPAAIVMGFEGFLGKPSVLRPGNWLLWGGMIGGLAGTLSHLYFRSNLSVEA